MMICVEGPDASGKSTLAAFLARALDLPIQASEGPPQYPGEMAERLERYAQLPPDTIFDRHPCVSEEMYSYAFGRPIAVTARQVRDFYKRHPFIIYCDPRPGVEHRVKPHDTPEHLLALHENHDRLLAAYRGWAIQHAHVIYHIGDDMQRFVHYATDFIGDIAAFHTRFEIAYSGPSRHLTPDLWQFRLKFMTEELCEYAGISEVTKSLIQSAILGEANPPPLCDQFDALIDLMYVALGTAHLQGLPFAEGWSRVHRANMRKIRVKNATESKRGHSADVTKPEGWQPPDLSGLVRGT